jgi:hypothetical protein
MIVLPKHMFETSYRTSQKPYLPQGVSPKYNDPEDEIRTTGTLICLINILQVSLSEVAPKKMYSKNSKMTFLRKKNPRINALIPNVMIQMLKIS